jgi:hypothetical protein
MLFLSIYIAYMPVYVYLYTPNNSISHQFFFMMIHQNKICLFLFHIIKYILVGGNVINLMPKFSGTICLYGNMCYIDFEYCMIILKIVKIIFIFYFLIVKNEFLMTDL